MKFKQLLTKSLLAAVCLLAGQSAWAKVEETVVVNCDFSKGETLLLQIIQQMVIRLPLMISLLLSERTQLQSRLNSYFGCQVTILIIADFLL